MAWNGWVPKFLISLTHTFGSHITAKAERKDDKICISNKENRKCLVFTKKNSFILPINVHIASIFSSLLFHGNPRKLLDFSISWGIPLKTIWSPHFHICKNLRVWYFNFIHYFSIQLDFEDILKIQTAWIAWVCESCLISLVLTLLTFAYLCLYLIGSYWALLGLTEPYWALLGLTWS